MTKPKTLDQLRAEKEVEIRVLKGNIYLTAI